MQCVRVVTTQMEVGRLTQALLLGWLEVGCGKYTRVVALRRLCFTVAVTFLTTLHDNAHVLPHAPLLRLLSLLFHAR